MREAEEVLEVTALAWGVIEACCRTPALLGQVLERVRPEDLVPSPVRTAFGIIRDRHLAGLPYDKPLVLAELREHGHDGLELLDDRYQLLVPEHALDAADRIARVLSCWRLRLVGQELSLVTPSDLDAKLAYGIQRLQQESRDRAPSERNTAELAEELIGEIERDATAPVIATGIPTLDRALGGGLMGSRLYVVGARPAVGKSALATGWARLALEGGHRVLIWSLEMTPVEIMRRILVERHNITGRRDDAAHVRALIEAAHRPDVQDWQLHITEAFEIDRVLARATHLRPALIIVDYLQLIRSERITSETRAVEIGMYSRSLKLLAQQLACPVVALSQLNRSLEVRADRKPRLSDLRESGAIEQDADVVMLLHRDAEGASMEAELIVAKNRHGPTGTVPLVFAVPSLRFRERWKEAG